MPTLLVQWEYTPSDIFEERVELRSGPYLFVLNSGHAEVSTPADDGPVDYHPVRTELHERVNGLLLAAQVLSHESYSLSAPRLTRIHADGRRDSFIFPAPGRITIRLGRTDTICTDATGTRDTRKERINQRNSFAELAAEYLTNPVASSILRSYSAAVADPRNEFLHLYEIREAIAKHLRTDGATKDGIIGGTRWQRLRKLANQEPVLQGRHRGQYLGALREATPEELAEARDIGRAMIEEYLLYLRNMTRR